MGTTAQKLAYTASGVTDAYNAVNEKGGSIAPNAPLVELGAAIRGISQGDTVTMSPTTFHARKSSDSFLLTASCSDYAAIWTDASIDDVILTSTLSGQSSTVLVSPNNSAIQVTIGVNTTSFPRTFTLYSIPRGAICTITQD